MTDAERTADEAMREIWTRWATLYLARPRAADIQISMADQQAFYEIAQPIMRALSRPAPAQEWRPIETAPVGEDVILFSPDGSPEILVGHRFCDEVDEDWYPQHESYLGGGPFDIGFTHWMPFPAPPVAQSSALREGE